jgi:hypothetical protein
MDDFPNNLVDQALTPLAKHHGVTLGAIAKNEGRYLPEWIAYHLAIGFDRIVVYSNDTEDNQNDVLEAIAKHDRRVRWVDWPSLPADSAQNSAYRDLLRWCRTPWVAFVDLDEFVVPLEDAGIHEWLATIPDDVSTVRVNWRGFGSGGVTSPDYDLVTRAFEMAAPRHWGNNCHFKSFARTALARDATAHNIVAAGGRAVLSDFGAFEMINLGISDRVVHHRIQINHYQCKTFPEFQVRMRKGSVAVPSGHPGHVLDDSRERFEKLDLNADLDRSIRRFDAAVDISLKRIRDFIDEGAPPRL